MQNETSPETGGVKVRVAFNSLFEMPLERAVTMFVGEAVHTFNSLFEMPQPVALPLSI